MKRLFLSSVLLLSVGMSTSSVTANAHNNEMETSQYSPHLENFDGKTEEAKKWHEERFKKFENKLHSDEKKLIERIENPELGYQNDLFSKPDLNTLFKLTNGDPKALPDTIKYGSMKTEIIKKDQVMKELFKAKPYTLEEDMVVHQQFSWYQYQALGDAKSIRDSKTREFTSEMKHVIEDNLDWGVHNYYAVYELTPPKNVNEEFIKIELTLPKHTKVLLKKDGQIILDRGQGYKVKGKPRIVKQGGEYVFVVKADLISEEELEHEKKRLDQKINEKLNELPFFKDFSIMYPIETELVGEFASVMGEPIVESIKDLVATFPPALSKKLIELMIKYENKITFTDKNNAFSEKLKDKFYAALEKEKWIPSQVSEDYMDKMFLDYVNDDGTTILGDVWKNINNNFIHDKIENNDTLRHEMGHVIDYFSKGLKEDSTSMNSGTPEFKQLYSEEKEGFTRYGTKNEGEFWAEVVMYLYSPEPFAQNIVKHRCPKASAYIIEKINDLINS